MKQNRKINSYKDLIVWQKSVELAILVYELTEKLPQREIFGLVSQMRRAVVSISSNISEGKMRGSRKDFAQFLRTAYGSGAELETQVLISKKVFAKININYSKVDALLDEIMRMLNVIIIKLIAKS